MVFLLRVGALRHSSHDNPAAHHPARVALGMEMFNPLQQQALNAWVT